MSLSSNAALPGSSGHPRAPEGPGARPDAIIFDLFHTLVDVGAIGGPTTPELLGIDSARWNRAMLDHAAHHALGSEPDVVESIRKVVHSLDPTIPEEEIRAAAAARPERFRRGLIDVDPKVVEAIRKLRGMGYRIGLLSNAGLDEVGGWPESPLAPLFDAALFSCYEKLMKPDPAFFHLAAGRLGVHPERCLYVGDGGSREHEGARRAGMRTVLILGLLQAALPEVAEERERNTDWVVETIDDVVELAGALAEGDSQQPGAKGDSPPPDQGRSRRDE